MKHIVLTSMPDARQAAKWKAFLADAPFASHYVTPNYFIDPYVRGQRFAVLAIDGRSRIAGVLTGVIDDESIMSGLFARPQIIFRKGVDRQATMAAVMNGVNEINAGNERLIELHSWDAIGEPIDHGFEEQTSTPENSVVMLDLSAGADALFKNFSQTRRSEIRKAEREKLVEIKEPETFIEQEALYRIHCDWNARKGNASESFEQLKTAIAQRENRRVFIAKVDAKTIAGSFYRFCPGGVVEYAANFSLPEFQRLRPNDLIGWHAIKWAYENGLSHFSMGGSHHFLRRFGGEIMTTHRYTRDERPFGMHRLKTTVREFGVETYRRLPANVRAGVRRVFAR